jgi:hypothetical protein
MSYPSFNVGEVLTAADMNAVGLWEIGEYALSGTSTQIDNIFTSNYVNYRFVFDKLTISTVDFLTARLVDGTTPNTNNSYYFAGLQVTTGAVVSGLGGGPLSYWSTQVVGFTTPAGGIIDLFNPAVASATSFTSQGIDTRTNGAPFRSGSGFHTDSTAFEGIWFGSLNGGYTLGGSVRVYGYRN